MRGATELNQGLTAGGSWLGCGTQSTLGRVQETLRLSQEEWQEEWEALESPICCTRSTQGPPAPPPRSGGRDMPPVGLPCRCQRTCLPQRRSVQLLWPPGQGRGSGNGSRRLMTKGNILLPVRDLLRYLPQTRYVPPSTRLLLLPWGWIVCLKTMI